MPYTAEEDALLRKLFPIASRAEILTALPGHDWHHLQKAAERRGLKRERRKHNIKWDGRPVQVLRALYPLGGAKAVVDELGPAFTLAAVRLAAVRLKVCYVGPILPPPSGSPPYSPQEERAMRRLWPTAPKSKVLAALPGRTWDQIRNWCYRQLLTRTAPRANAAQPKPPKVVKPKVVKQVKPKPLKAVVAKPLKEPVLPVHDHRRKAKNTLKPLHIVGAATKTDPRTPVLNASKAARLRGEKAVKAESVSEQVKKLPYTHPARMAYMLNAKHGGPAATAAFYAALNA